MIQRTNPSPLRSASAHVSPVGARWLLAALLLAGCSATLEGSAPVDDVMGLPPQSDGSVTRLDAGSVSERDAANQPDRGSCDVVGRFAIRVAFNVVWVGTSFAGLIPIIAPGEGELSFIVLADILNAGSGTMAVAQACAASVPDFESSLPLERYSAHFPEAMWESARMPRFQVTTRYGCFDPGCAFDTEPFFAQLGSQLATPSGAWPMRGAGNGWPDHDGDQRPGITAQMRGPTEQDKRGRAYAYPPITPVLLRRARELMFGLRVGVTLRGELDGCDRLKGEAPMGSIDTRAIECVAADGFGQCNADELAFLDDNLPVWTVRGGSFRGIRVDDTADCAAARGAFP